MTTENEYNADHDLYDATYSPEDNKLRLYAAARLSSDEYQRIKAAGFKWAPKQDLFVAPRWTPEREDILLDMAGEIGDENYSALERSADRAERFSDYRDKRTAEATGHAKTYESGPQAFGHQSRARAERAARRHGRERTRAVTQWDKAEYWQERTRGVIAHAKFKASPRVRRGRIKKLESELRGQRAALAKEQKKWEAWQEVASTTDAERAGKLAYALANMGGGWFDYQHPHASRRASLYSMLTDPAEPITPQEAAALYLGRWRDPSDESTETARWIRHLERRLEYENAMLAEEGGAASEADIVPGGFFGRYQVERVHKSSATGRVTSVSVMAADPWHRGPEPAPLKLQNLNIERFAEDAYRAPTEAELAEFKARKSEERKSAKAEAAKNPKPKLLNPTEADAARLQTLWNERERLIHAKAKREHRTYSDFEPSEVRRLTQKQYSAASKGTYARYETMPVLNDGKQAKFFYGRLVDDQPIACNVRRGPGQGDGFSFVAPSLVILTDKPQKPLPIDWEAAEAELAKLREEMESKTNA